MYENAFNQIERDLRAEEGIANELDYVEQTSWVLFLKYLHDLENERRDRAELNGETYAPIIDGEHRWDQWAAPKDKAGAFDHNAALIGDDLIKFVDQNLFPYLAAFRQSATGPRTIHYKIGEVFTELRSKFRSGYILRDVLEIIDGLSFNTQEQRHELSQLYETRIRRMGNAGRNGGEYYTPRPLIRAMVKVVDPKIGETIYDGAVGSAGFLCEAYDYMRSDRLSASNYDKLQTSTFYGQEKKGLAYIIGIMNMVLHGIETPNLVHTNTLNENVMDIQEKDRHDVILANPPFGGGERREVQQNFRIRTGETCALTGARVGELAQLRREDVSQQQEMWVIRITPEAGTVKTNEARVVPLDGQLVEMGFPAFVASSAEGHLFLKVGRGESSGCSSRPEKPSCRVRPIRGGGS